MHPLWGQDALSCGQMTLGLEDRGKSLNRVTSLLSCIVIQAWSFPWEQLDPAFSYPSS